MPVDLSDYNTVAMRIAEFRKKHPEGSLRPVNLDEPFKVLDLGGKQFICYTAAAYRTPDDARPGIGVAWEPFPGRTPYTRDSELMNAETSAWGRAIVAVLAADTVAGIATREEITNRRADQEAQGNATRVSDQGAVQAKAHVKAAPEVSDAQIEELRKLISEAPDTEALNALFKKAGAIGALPAETVDPETGVKSTIQEIMYSRADAIKSQNGDSSPKGRKTAAAK